MMKLGKNPLLIPPLDKLYRLGIRFPKSVLLFSLIVTCLSVLGARHLTIQTDLTSLLPQHNENVQNFNRIKKHFGGMGHLLVTLESPDFSLSEHFADEFVPKIGNLPAILYVDYKPPADFFKKRKWLYIDREDLLDIERRIDRALELQKKGISPLLSRWIALADREDRGDLDFRELFERYEKKYLGAKKTSASGGKSKLLVLWVKVKENPQNLAANRELMDDIRNIERKLKANPLYAPVQVGYAGDYQTSVEQAEYTRTQIAWVSIVVFVLLLLVLLFFFRKISSVFMVGLPLILGIVWTGGFVAITPGHLNILTGFTAAILAGLGSDYGIYLLSRFERERKNGQDFETVCRLTFAHTGKATFGSMLTTVAAFVSLFFSDFNVFVEFGVVGATGLFFNYLAMMLVIPAVLALTEKRSVKVLSSRTWFDRLTTAWFDTQTGLKWLTMSNVFSFFRTRWPVTDLSFLFNTRRPVAVIMIILVLCGLGALTIRSQSRIFFEDTQMQSRDLPGRKLNDRVIAQEGVYSSPTLLIHEGADQEEKTVRSLENMLKTKTADELVFNRVLGLTSFVPTFQDEKKEILRRIAEKMGGIKIPQHGRLKEIEEGINESVEAPPITAEGLPREIRHRFESVSEKGFYAVYLYSAIYRETEKDMRRYEEGVKALAKDRGLSFIPVDSNFITHDVIALIQKESPRLLAFILSFLAVFVFVTIRPLARGLILTGHLVAGLIILSGVLWLARIPLNVMNVVMFPIILGTGIDCFIHFNHRFDETRNLDKTLILQVPSILVSNLTTVIGFGGLLLTTSKGLRSIGWVAVIGIALITLLCVFVFPRVLAVRPSSSEVRQ